MKRIAGLLLGISTMYLLSGCPGKVKATFQSTAPPSTLANSKISLVNDGAMADGTSAVVVLINFINTSNDPQAGISPEYDVEGDGVVKLPCTTSNSEGLSVCMLKSTVEGTKTFKVTNVEGLDLKSALAFGKFEPQKPGFSTGGGSTTVATGVGIKQAEVSYLPKYETTLDSNGDKVLMCRVGGVEAGAKTSCLYTSGNAPTPADIGKLNPDVVVWDESSGGQVAITAPCTQADVDNSVAGCTTTSDTKPATLTVSTGITTSPLKAISTFGEPLSLVEQKMVAEADLCTKNDVTNSLHGCTAVGNARSGATILGKARANMQGVLNE